jgi:hypothetical protein
LAVAGNVGVGTASPAAKLDVRSSGTFTGDPQARFYDTRAVAADIGGGINFGGTFTGTTVTTWAGISGLKENATDGNYAGCLAFFTRPNGTGASERMRLDSAGNLGLGVPPSLWLTDVKAFDVNTVGSLWGFQSGANVQTGVTNNAFINSSAQYIYKVDAPASNYLQASGAHQWQIAPSGTAGNAISFTQAMTLDANGRLVVGDTANVQLSRAEFTSTSLTPAFLARVNVDADEGQWAGQFQKKTATNTTSQVFVRFLINDGATPSGYITANGANAATFTSSSDARLKENIADLPSQLNKVMSLRPVEFDYKDGTGHQIGFIAQEMQTIYPDSVSEGADKMLQIGGWSKTEARLVKAIQEQQTLITALTDRITTLESSTLQ